MKRQVTVSVPATTANLGPGFDCLGLALEMRNRLTFTELSSGLEVTVTGEGAATIPTDDSNLVVRAAEQLFERADRRPGGLHILQENGIPIASGLGSSAAAVVGGIMGAAALVDSSLKRSQLLALANAMEGHPDNVTPALFGGLTLTVQDGDRLIVERLPVFPFQAGVVLPEFYLPTQGARSALPKVVPLSDAVFNASRLGLLIQALADGDFQKLKIAMQDRLHQPYRLPLIPGMAQAFEIAGNAGAVPALSGAGPSILVIAQEGLETTLTSVRRAFSDAGLQSRSWILPVSEQGCFVRVINKKGLAP